MPSYVYDLIDPTDPHTPLSTVVLQRPVLRRDAVQLRRRTVPDSCGGAAHAGSQRDEVLAGYHRSECEQGSRFRSAYSAREIHRIWSQPEP